MGADNAPRVAHPAAGGDAATTGGVVAGSGRDVAGPRLNVCLTDPPDPQPSISLPLHGGTGAPFRARRSVLSQLGGQLAETGAADVALIVSELVTNSVLHANVGPDQTLTVECTALPDRLRITVTGHRMAATAAPETVGVRPDRVKARIRAVFNQEAR